MRRGPLTLVAGWTLIALAWAMANPPFAAPDEGAHYLRALGVSEGTLVGAKTAQRPAGLSPAQSDFVGETMRVVPIPGALSPPDSGCYIREPRLPAACIDPTGAPPPGTVPALTIVGSYQLLPYLLPAVATRLAGRAAASDRLGRVASLIPALAALALAVALLWEPRTGGASLLGPVVAVTPMVLFCAASLTGSGIEIAAAIAFVAALLRVRRDGEAARAWVWAAVGASGALLSLSRSASPVWLALAILVFLALVGPRRAARLVMRRRAALLASAGIAMAVILNRVWESAYGASVVVSASGGRHALRAGAEQLRTSADQLVIAYGYLEFKPPLALALAWLALVVALVVAAVVVARWRERVVLLAASAGAVLVPILLYVLVYRWTEFNLQGRHVLPALVAVPLLAGELLREGWERLAAVARRALLVAVPPVAGAGQVVAWWLDGRRSAVGIEGPLWFLPDARWEPPLGWAPWMALVLAGACLAALALAPAALRRAPEPRP